MQRISRPSLYKTLLSYSPLRSSPRPVSWPSFPPSINSAWRRASSYTGVLKGLDIEDDRSDLSIMYYYLDDAFESRQVSRIEKCHQRCNELIKDVVGHLHFAQRVVPADDERMVDSVRTVREMEADVEAFSEEYRLREASKSIRRLILWIQEEHQKQDEESMYCYLWWRTTCKEALRHAADHQMTLLRWMGIQVQLLEEDGKHLESLLPNKHVCGVTERIQSEENEYTPQKFLQIPMLLAHYDKLLENKFKLSSRQGLTLGLQDDDNAKQMHDELIFNVFSKIAKTQERVHLAFHQGFSVGVNKEECVVSIPKAIKEVTEEFHDLALKIPMSYFDVKLKQWLEQIMKPKVDDILSKVPHVDMLKDPEFEREDSWISSLEAALDDAVTYKYTDHSGLDLRQCNYIVEVILANKRNVVSRDERMQRIALRIEELKDEVKIFSDEYQSRKASNTILGLVLKVNEGAYEVESNENQDYSYPPRYTICNYKDSAIKHVLPIFKESLLYAGNHEMLLMRWMYLQIQMLKEDARDLETKYSKEIYGGNKRISSSQSGVPRNFLNVSLLLSHYDKYLETKSKNNVGQIQEIDMLDDGSLKLICDNLVFNAVLKIAKARERMCKAFESKFYAGEIMDELVTCIPKSMEEATQEFEDLFAKLPMNYYDVTLKQWLEIKLRPRIDEFMSKAKAEAGGR